MLKEKAALDVSIAALSSDKSSLSTSEDGNSDESKKQLNTIMSSLATLSAEKSRMEASFLANKKALNSEIETKNRENKELSEKLKKSMMALSMEKENFKAKLTSYDRILNDERHLKENLETQLNQLKTAFSQTSNSDKVIKDLTQELLEAKKKIRAYENNNSKFKDDSSVLQALQAEMENLKQQNIKSLMLEKQRANEANERSRKLTALHEERVQSLEARLSELSVSLTSYHNLRESDQQNIIQLKDKITQLSQNPEEIVPTIDNFSKFPNVQAIIDEIERLKHVLIVENTKLDQPIDLSTILSRRFSVGSDATVSAQKYSNLRQDFDKVKSENEMMNLQVKDQSKHIKTLQEKVQVLNQNIDTLEIELKNKSLEVNIELKAERKKCRETINAMEGDHRTKVSQLEQQLQKQRERSLTLLEEKENEIRTLKTSHDVFLPKKSSISQYEDDDRESSSSSRRKSSVSYLGTVLNQPLNSAGNLPETHMIYYSNELARKEMELTSIRKAKREAESLIRQTLKEKIMMQETMDDRIAFLEQQVDR